MTLQPVHAVAPDAELLVTTYLRAALAARPEAFAQDVWVDNKKPVENKPRIVRVRRDGGPRIGLFDNARLGVSVWAETDQESADLARLVQALMLLSPGTGGVVQARSLLGPSPVPDAAQFQRYSTFELRIRCAALV